MLQNEQTDVNWIHITSEEAEYKISHLTHYSVQEPLTFVLPTMKETIFNSPLK